ncbi:MAG TPA: universal stress protein [Microbacterium sp.]|jgi:nucleotide-binding universal stress UspA family protein|nr:universal stress protein [Microbacterium sp.]
MERILVADDGSAASTSAMEWAASRARREAATIDVLSAETAAGEPGGDVGVRGNIGARGDIRGPGDLLVVGADHGRPTRAALTDAASRPAGGITVVVVPAGWVATADPVTVGIADDESSSGALAFAAREAETNRVPLRLVHAWLMATPPFARARAEASEPHVQTPDEAAAQHRRTLEAAAGWVDQRHPRVEVQRELVRDSMVAALLRFAPRSSLIAVGTHRRGPFADHLLGRVAQAAAWQDCPIALVPVTPRRA